VRAKRGSQLGERRRRHAVTICRRRAAVTIAAIAIGAVAIGGCGGGAVGRQIEDSYVAVGAATRDGRLVQHKHRPYAPAIRGIQQ